MDFALLTSSTLTLSCLSSPLLPPHPTPQLSQQDQVSNRLPPMQPSSLVQSQTEQSIDMFWAIIVSFPAYLRPMPASFDVSKPGLLEKKVS